MTNQILIQENIAHISILAGALIQEGKLDMEDSSEFVSNIIMWAKEFEDTTFEEYDDYLDAIDGFATAKLMEHYGVKNEAEGYKPLYIESYLAGVTQEQFDRYTEYAKEAKEQDADYIDDIGEYLDKCQEEYKTWFDESVEHSVLNEYEVLCGQNGVSIKDLIEECFDDGTDILNVYNY